MDGIYSTDLPLVAALDEVVGNVEIDGIQRSARQSMADHAEQIAADGPIAEALAEETSSRIAADTALGLQVDELAALPSQVTNLTGRVDAVETIALSGVKSAKQSVRLLVTTATDPATMTAGSTLDGLILAVNDRIGRATPAGAAADGVYVVQAAGAAIRSADMDTEAELIGARFEVEAGTHASETWALQTPSPIVVGTTVLTLVKTSSANATTAEVIAGRGGYASLSEHFDALAGVGALIATQTIGRSVAPVTGTALPSQQYVYANTISADGYLASVQYFAMNAGDVVLRRWSKTVDDFAQIEDELILTLSAGLHTLTPADFGTWRVKTGDRIGFYQNNVLAYLAAAADSGGYYNTASNVSAFTDAAVASAFQFQIGLSFSIGSVPSLDKRVASIESSQALYEVQTIGRKTAPVTGSAATANTYIYGEVIRRAGVLSAFRAFALSATTAFIKRFARSGNDWSQVGVDLPVALAVGLNQITEDQLGYFPVNAGEYLGLYASNTLASNGGIGDDFGWYASAGNLSGFTAATAVTTRLAWGFDVTPGPLAGIKQRVIDLEQAGADRYDDSITDGTFAATGLNITTAITFNRNGALSVHNDARALAAATATYTRYDVLYYDIEAGTFGLVAGTERTTDPTAFIPALSSALYVPLYLLRVTSTAVTATPMWDLDANGEVRDVAAQMEEERRRNRRILKRSISKARRRASLRVLGFGDSITAIAGGASGGVTTGANGIARDAGAANSGTYQYLRAAYGADVVSAIPLYTSLQLGRADDGGGAIHTKVGWNWELVAGLVGIGYTLGTDLFYDNFGIAGYATADAVSGVTPTAWLTNAAAVAADLAIVCLGMNELGNDSTGDRMEIIIQTLQTAGMDVLVLGVPSPGSSAGYEETNRRLKRAAYKKGAGFLSMMPIYDARYIQAIGIDITDVCAANNSNHPGLLEHAAVGRELVKLVLG
ncbi:hypothetical protein [Mesorhizobium sp. M0965]|uniref:hypothetical protein n=1 Tax=unclassified Mesorhizobium TaxID=325217 RepID=UPI003336CB79